MGHGIFHSTFYCTLKLSWVGYDLLLQIEVKTLSRRNDSTELDETGEDETVADETGVDELGIIRTVWKGKERCRGVEGHIMSWHRSVYTLSSPHLHGKQ